MYRERPAPIGGAVVWSRTVSAEPAPARVLPDGCVDLIWSSRVGLLVAGPDTTAQLAVSGPGERYVGLRLPPGVGPAVLGVPAHELRDQRVPLAAIWAGPLVAALTEQAATGTAGTVLAEVAARRLAAAGGPDPLAPALVARLRAGDGVAAAAARLGVGTRQLHRRSRSLFGYGPKTLARILRLQRALALARGGTPLAEVAAVTGYADQAHLTRDVRDLAGVPPATLLTTG